MEEKEKRRRTIQIRLSDEEYEAIEKKFRNSGMKSKSDFIRSMILQGYIALVDYEKEIELCRKVKGISVNINQIAKRVNATGHLYADDLAELKKGVSEIWQQQKSFQSKITRLGHLDTLPIQTKPMAAD